MNTEIEKKFLEEWEVVKNKNGVYLYQSHNGNLLLHLDDFLLSYKDWLIENGYVEPNKKNI